MAVPGAFTPERIDDRLLVDGGLRQNLPVQTVRAMGADVIIAVDLGTTKPTDAQLANPLGVAQQMVNILLDLNVYASREALKPTDVAEEKLSGLCDWIKRGCDAHTGITAGTFYRDEGWCFYQLGAAIECADQTTRLLDVKYLSSEARAGSEPATAVPGSAVDVSYWTALLRAAAGYQAYRRRRPRGMDPEQVAIFLLCDACFPRSVACNFAQIEEHPPETRQDSRFHGRSIGEESVHVRGRAVQELAQRRLQAYLTRERSLLDR